MRNLVILSIISLVLVSAIITLFIGTATMEQESKEPKIAHFMTIAEMKTYDKFYKPREPTPPLPESEIANIVFSKNWILENDEDKRADYIKVTFPASWVSESLGVREDPTFRSKDRHLKHFPYPHPNLF